MDYTFTEKEVEMMYNWGYTSEIEHGFEAEEQKLQPLPFLRNKVNQIQIHHPSIQGLVDTDMESFFLKIFYLLGK